MHTIISCSSHGYTWDNGNIYKYCEIQPVTVVQKLDTPQEGPSRETTTKDQGIKRKSRKENIDLINIHDTKGTKQKTDRFLY